MRAIVERPSPNCGPRPRAPAIDLVVIHYTGMPTGAEALERLCDPTAAVSAHYLVEEDGTTFRLVADEMRAWHAGVSGWAGARDINDRSIGIELVNPGHEWGYRPFPAPQMAALLDLLRDLVGRHPIPPHRIVGHSDVSPARKTDPGELFDWPALARAGFGLWPTVGARVRIAAAGEPEVRDLLTRLGYDFGLPGADFAAVVRAFQRHFRPGHVDGVADSETCALLEDLCDKLAGC
jgi:N-acetylmuramoyl-L-alanine amidase